MRSLDEIVLMNNPNIKTSKQLQSELNKNAIAGLKKMFTSDLNAELDKIGIVSYLNRNPKKQ